MEVNGLGKQVFTKPRGRRVAVAELEGEVQDLLRECERRIDAAQTDAWHALRKIHDDKLYKADGYASFKEYVEQRWGYSKSHAHRLIDHSKIIDYLKAEGIGFLPGGEGLTRPFAKFRRKYGEDEEAFLQASSEAWRASMDAAPKAFDVPQVTVQHVESTMERLGLWRNAKPKSTASAGSEVRALLTKLGKSDGLKMSPEAFVKRFADKGFPSDFFQILDWMRGCAELMVVEEVGVKT
jgi:hypothetical protein